MKKFGSGFDLPEKIAAKAELEKAKQALGVEGKENPKIRSAIAQLKKTQIDLSRTTILAPSHGGITNLKIDEGHYASVGAPLMTFIEVDNATLHIWNPIFIQSS